MILTVVQKSSEYDDSGDDDLYKNDGDEYRNDDTNSDRGHYNDNYFNDYGESNLSSNFILSLRLFGMIVIINGWVFVTIP